MIVMHGQASFEFGHATDPNEVLALQRIVVEPLLCLETS